MPDLRGPSSQLRGQLELTSAVSSASRPLSVSELIRQAARTLESRFPDIWVEGELDSVKRHAPSGHLYFVLKDATGRLEAMMPRLRAQRLRFPPQDGLKVRARGRVSLYEPQGRFQLYVEEMEPWGEGELLRAFEELKARLAREGLFDSARKRPLPPFPRCIGIATSTSGAALQDIIRVAMRRGRVRLLVAPCQVQGEGAPEQIIAALELLQQRPEVEVIIVGRGGGSAADLWAFNDERLARAVARCRVPVVSAVGHEVDITICDFVADLRAPTPSAAAEMVVPLFSSLQEELAELHRRVVRAGRRTLDAARQRLDWELKRAGDLLGKQLAACRRKLAELQQQLEAQHPRARLLRDREALEQLHGRLLRAERNLLAHRRHHFEGLLGRLEALSPLRVLQRGYAVAQDEAGRVLLDARSAQIGQRLWLRLASGELGCRVEEIRT
ncbi:MAG: exodeoxyribonuclease VII large subunit [Myxococcales bacterium]|nr:exodeoxyribonuclease VII large subunit [Myxococcales bacterium]